MDSVLIIVTLISLAMTVALAAVVAKLLRDERRRSDARVTALTDMAEAARRREAIAIKEEEEEEDLPLGGHAPSMARAGARSVTAGALELNRVGQAVTSGELFAAPEQRSPWPRRLGVVAAVALVATVIGAVAWSRSTLGKTVGSDPAAGLQTSAPASSGLLELLLLKHTQQADALTITGLVQNPRDGVPLSKVAATAFLFAADGTFLASGRVPLDFTVLRPGDESAFVISVPVTVPVARYRIGFRGEDGRIIGHVDRRGTATMADAVRDGARGSS